MSDALAGLRPDGARRLGDPLVNSMYQYFITFTLTANGTLSNVINLDRDADFICVSSSMDITTQTGGNFGTGVVGGGVLVLLSDGGTQRQLANSPIPGNLLFGTAQRPFVWPWTHQFLRGTSIKLQVTELLGAAPTVRFVFNGYKLGTGR